MRSQRSPAWMVSEALECDSGAQLRLCSRRTVPGDILAVSPLGTAVATKRGEWLECLDLDGGTSRKLFESRWYLNADFSPDGQYVVYHDWYWCSMYSLDREQDIQCYVVLHPDYALLGSVEFVGSTQLLLGEADAKVLSLATSPAVGAWGLSLLHGIPIGQATQRARRRQEEAGHGVEWAPVQQAVSLSALGCLAASDREHLRLWHADDFDYGHLQQLPEPFRELAGCYTTPTWSPDGRLLAVRVSEPERVQVLDGRRGEILWGREGPAHLLTFSPCRSILLTLADEALEVWEADSGRRLGYFGQFGITNVRGAGFLNDGRLYVHGFEPDATASLPEGGLQESRLVIWEMGVPGPASEWKPERPRWTFPETGGRRSRRKSSRRGSGEDIPAVSVRAPASPAQVGAPLGRPLTLSLPQDLQTRLDHYAQLRSLGVAQVVEAALQSFLPTEA